MCRGLRSECLRRRGGGGGAGALVEELLGRSELVEGGRSKVGEGILVKVEVLVPEEVIDGLGSFNRGHGKCGGIKVLEGIGDEQLGSSLENDWSRRRCFCCLLLLLLSGLRLGRSGRCVRGSPLLVTGIAADLPLPARIASLDDAHEVGMVPLLLGLASPGGRVGDISAILGHDPHARVMGKVDGLLAGARNSRLLGGLGYPGSIVEGGWGSKRGRGLGPRVRVGDDWGDVEAGCVARVDKLRRACWRSSADGSKAGGGDGVELEVEPGALRVAEEVHGDVGALVLDGCRTRDEGVDHLVELGGAHGREPGEGLTEVGLADREALHEGVGRIGSRHASHLSQSLGGIGDNC